MAASTSACQWVTGAPRAGSQSVRPARCRIAGWVSPAERGRRRAAQCSVLRRIGGAHADVRSPRALRFGFGCSWRNAYVGECPDADGRTRSADTTGRLGVPAMAAYPYIGTVCSKPKKFSDGLAAAVKHTLLTRCLALWSFCAGGHLRSCHSDATVERMNNASRHVSIGPEAARHW